VLERLAGQYGVARSQLEAEGMGYLAPVATNLTPEGREVNRRVEVILLSTE
jgi:OOP family OmpA-OmpF porin